MKIDNIFVSAIGYNCEEHLQKVLSCFLMLKGIFSRVDKKVTISVAHGVFPEVHELGYSVHSSDKTEELLRIYKEEDMILMSGEDVSIDSLFIAKEPMLEKDLRNATLKGFDLNQYDFLWLLDLQDEIYSLENITKILAFIHKNEFLDWFKVSFKNYVINDKTWIDGFTPPRIWRTKIHGGIEGFYYDNDIKYKDGSLANNLPSITIPASVAFVPHLSWVGTPEYLKRKIEFQKKHYLSCSYEWDEENNRLKFNKDYFVKNNIPFPELHSD